MARVLKESQFYHTRSTVKWLFLWLAATSETACHTSHHW